jgi:hypothetical protein
MICPKCRGSKVLPKDEIPIIGMVCDRCKGHGELDWIKYANGNPPDGEIDIDFYRQLAIKNSQILITAAQNELQKAGIRAKIGIEKYENYNDYMYRTQKIFIKQPEDMKCIKQPEDMKCIK